MMWSNIGPRRTRKVWFGLYVDPWQGGSFLCSFLHELSLPVTNVLGEPPFWDACNVGVRIILEDEC
jgi:hypothetical protein